MRASWIALMLAACGGSSVSNDVADDVVVDAVPDVVSDPDVVPDVPDVVPSPPPRVLFIGNSYTHQNDLPGVVRALGAAVATEMIAPGGASLGTHGLTPATMERIASGDFDVVVLQGQSVEPMSYLEGFLEWAGVLSDAAHAAGTDVVWFATWARHADSAEYPGLGDPAWMTWALEDAYVQAAAPHGDAVARVGSAFALAAVELPDVVLHAGDGSHASAAGSLLAGCVIAHAITGQAPVVPDPAPLGLARDTAVALCTLATRVGPAPRACKPPQELCGDTCVYLDWNPAHCGRCDAPCDAGDPCRSGVCGCDAPLEGCDLGCHDLTTSALHCGACASPCAIGEHCVTSDCTCADAALLEVGLGELMVHNEGCIPGDFSGPELATLPCREAAHALCVASSPCFTSGLPPPTGHSERYSATMCVRGEVHVTDFATLAVHDPACDGVTDRSGLACFEATSRYCASLGQVSGFGPIGIEGETAGDAVTVTCVPAATRVTTTREALQQHASRCVPHPLDCQNASRSLCESLGYVGGFGPVPVVGDAEDDAVDVVCVSP